jgi:hypothetical protein
MLCLVYDFMLPFFTFTLPSPSMGEVIIWIPAFAGMVKSAPYLGEGSAFTAAAIGEMVAFRFFGDGVGDDVFEFLDGGAATEWLFEVDFVLVEEAEAELAVGGEAKAVAPEAEVLGDGGDKADGAPGAGQAEVFGGPVAHLDLTRFELA